MTTTPMPELPKNTPHIVRRIRACESEVPAQLVLEHAMQAYAIAAIEASQPAIDVKHQALYRAANELMAIIGMNGPIEARSQEVDAVMEALFAIDGGNPLTQPAASQLEPLTDDEIEAIGHRKASTYTHRPDPTSHAYGFVRHTLIDFARAILAVKGESK